MAPLLQSSGVYNYEFISTYGCDSLVSVDVILNPTYSIGYDAEICFGETYILPDGSNAESSGNYVSNLQTVSGCDSTITVFLEVFDLPSLSTDLEVSYCHYDGDIEITPQPPGGNLSGDLLNGFILEHEGAEGGEYSISYTYTDSNGCTNTLNQDYILADILSPEISYNISCHDLNLVSSIDNETNIIYWYLDDELVGAGSEFTVVFNEYGDF